MIGANPFYHKIIRKAIISFGNLFSDIHVVSKDKDDVTQRIVKCPISYANKQQWFNRINGDPEFLQKFEIDLPRLSFEVTGYQYNPSRRIGNQFDSIFANCGVPKNVTTPVPYTITFQLSSYTKNQDDSLQITEQIIPYFAPALILTIDVLDDIDLSMDIPLSMVGIQTEDNYTDLDNNRFIITTYTFEMEVQLFGPYDSKVNVIKKVIADINDKKDVNSPFYKRFTATVNPRTAERDDTYTIDELWAGQI